MTKCHAELLKENVKMLCGLHLGFENFVNSFKKTFFSRQLTDS